MSELEDFPDEILLKLCEAMDDQTLGRAVQTYKRIGGVCKEELDRRKFSLNVRSIIATMKFEPILTFRKRPNGSIDETVIDFFKEAYQENLLTDLDGNPIDISLLVKGYSTVKILAALLVIYLYKTDALKKRFDQQNIVLDDRIKKWFNPSFNSGDFSEITLLLDIHMTRLESTNKFQQMKINSLRPELTTEQFKVLTLLSQWEKYILQGIKLKL